MKRWFIAFFLLAQAAAAQLPAGWYRASVLRPDGAALVFNFEAQRTTGSLRLYIRNGSERLLVEEVREQGDSLFAEMPFFEARLRFRVLPNDRLTGTWSKGTAGADLELPVTATPGGEERFPGSRPASGQLAHELEGIDKAGLAGYFLIVWDIVRFAREQQIRCQGR
ncbi:MAG TPA: hypothetical protein PKE63_07640, partial [Lacibacter sp.]|nr:hypothetical protein [Lacibacter sp.]